MDRTMEIMKSFELQWTKYTCDSKYHDVTTSLKIFHAWLKHHGVPYAQLH